MSERPAPCRLIRLPAVQLLTGYKRTALYDHIEDGTMTESVSIGARAVAWPENEIEAINRARVAGADDDAVRALVRRLHADRTAPLKEAA